MSAAIYLRVSSEEQREKQSIEVQREFAKRYCAQHEWKRSSQSAGLRP